MFFFVGYGLLPVSMTFRTFDFSNPNTLEVSYQVFGCPTANARIVNGELQFSEHIKQKFPNLQESGKEITLIDLPLFENITGAEYNILIDNTFKITGQVIGVDTILCDLFSHEIVPKFQVSDWKITSYEPIFWLFQRTFFFVYWFSIILLLPTMAVLTIIKLIKPTRKIQHKNNCRYNIEMR
jgi:hypothetical protein